MQIPALLALKVMAMFQWGYHYPQSGAKYRWSLKALVVCELLSCIKEQHAAVISVRSVTYPKDYLLSI